MIIITTVQNAGGELSLSSTGASLPGGFRLSSYRAFGPNGVPSPVGGGLPRLRPQRHHDEGRRLDLLERRGRSVTGSS